MQIFRQPFFVFLLIASALALHERAFAEVPEPVLSGELDIEQDDPNRGSYRAVEGQTIAYFKTIGDRIAALVSGEVSKIDPVGDAELHHLSGVYLYCSMTYGACPFILETLMEIDVTNSRVSGTVSCDNTTRFLTHYAQNDMHKRLNYLIPTALMNTKSNFELATLPKFVACKDTVKQILGKFAKDPAYPSIRYAERSEPVMAVKKTNLILRTVKTKVGNIFKVTSTQ